MHIHATGKTALLNALAKFIADEDRILFIEDTSEIQLEKPNLVRFEARQAQPALPAITIRDLLKASLSLYSATTLKKKTFPPDSGGSLPRYCFACARHSSIVASPIATIGPGMRS